MFGLIAGEDGIITLSIANCRLPIERPSALWEASEIANRKSEIGNWQSAIT
jgi:hypothetical protein